jgi:uncharacterized membrane protein
MAGMAEIVLQNSRILLILPLIWLLVVGFAWRRRFKPFGPFILRLFIVVLVVLALAQPLQSSQTVANSAQPEQRSVVLVDQSASLGATGRLALRAEAARLIEELDVATVLFFAGNTLWVDETSSSLLSESFAESDVEALAPNGSNLAQALALGSELIHLDDQPGRLVLLSDGLQTAGDVLAAASRLAQQRIPVDVLVPDESVRRAWQDDQNEIRLVSLAVPPILRQGETFDLEVIIHSGESVAEGVLVLTSPSAGETLAEDVISLEAGLNRFTFSSETDDLGLKTFRVTIAADGDFSDKNNSAAAFTEVYPPPQILLVTEETATARRFGALLRAADYETIITSPEDLSAQISELEPYDGMVLLNVPAGAFELEQMIAIQEFVRSLGRGLLVTAGRQSFGLGRYEGTPLEDLLPVTLEPPPREERPPVALLLLIDHSGSMVEDRGSLATRLTMAKEAAIRATDILGPDDLIGIMMFDNRFEWVVPFRQVNDGAELLEIQQAVARIPGGGGTRILQALETALPELLTQNDAISRHAILFTDGKSFDGSRTIEDYNRIVDEAVEANITLSSIAIGSDADVDLLSHLAERGRGRYHFADTPEELPALTISESDILRSNTLQEGEFTAAIYAPHPIVRGIFSPLPVPGKEDAPELTGYLAMSPKPEAEVALQVGPGDPLLSVWGYGLGRVAAWSSDQGDEWTVDWRDWPEFERFFSQVVGYTLPAPNLGLLQLDTMLDPDGTVVLSAQGISATGQTVELARTEATLMTPAGTENEILLRQVGPGRYERRLRLADSGAYQLAVTQARNDAPAEMATTGFVVPYPAEFALPAAETGQPLLERIASLTGGETFRLGQSLRSQITTPDQIQDLAEPVELWPWLLLIALILWPLEIAWRRWGRLRIH